MMSDVVVLPQPVVDDGFDLIDCLELSSIEHFSS